MKFEIITYASESYLPALKMMLPSWEKNSGATRVRVFSDNKFQSPCTSPEMAWKRKIELLAEACLKVDFDFFCWLDADVYCRENFSEVFLRMGTAEIGATRMFNRTPRGHGAINSGVLFFRRTSVLPAFFGDWRTKTAELEAKGEGKPWFEQNAASQLVHEAFHGLRPYYAAPVSENIYNMEDDHVPELERRIKQYRPKLIHFKNGWWKQPDLVKRMILA